MPEKTFIVAANEEQAMQVAIAFGMEPGRWVHLTSHDQILGIKELVVWVYKDSITQVDDKISERLIGHGSTVRYITESELSEKVQGDDFFPTLLNDREGEQADQSIYFVVATTGSAAIRFRDGVVKLSRKQMESLVASWQHARKPLVFCNGHNAPIVVGPRSAIEQDRFEIIDPWLTSLYDVLLSLRNQVTAKVRGFLETKVTHGSRQHEIAIILDRLTNKLDACLSLITSHKSDSS